jgi:mono/diheme cytochrome c family protein
MRLFVQSLLGTGVLIPAVLLFTPFAPRSEAGGDDKPDRSPVPAAGSRPVSYLREVRPILAQHCFRCHGPDEATRKGKLRLDLKDNALAARKGKHVIAAGDPHGSLVWERITSEDPESRMPPEGTTTLTKKQIATLKAWIEQGAKWEEHWSLLPPTKPTIPVVSDKTWARDPLDAFVLARLQREGLRPAAEAGREAWLRRASFDLTGLPPTPAEVDEFLKDKSPEAYEKQVDRLLASPRYGERQAQEWLDLARYADTSGYQNDTPRQIWKWREWVVNAYNANVPFDRFAIEQLAGDLLPDATLAQRIATGFNRNHPTNSEAGEEEDEYRSAYVIDRVNTTATVFMGLTMACAQCHDHKYDPITQRDFYSFYSFFNNIKERDADFFGARPSIPVPNPDQEPRLADLKVRIAALQRRLDRADPLTDADQKDWERKTLARLAKPIPWTTATPTAVLSRNGAVLKLLGDGSVLSTGTAPVKDTYDVTLLPGKRRITAIRLEVLPDDSQPGKALGRATDGRFNLSAIEIRQATLADSQDPPLVYVSRAEADINQRPKEDPAAFDMFPGSIESAVVVEPLGTGPNGAFGFRAGWSIVGDERRKPHEAIFLPLDPLETNEASVLRISLHQLGGAKFKSLIGRFRISYTEDDRVRELLMPAQTKLWSSIGPFPAEDVTKGYATAFEPEKDIQHEPLDLKKNYNKVVFVPEAKVPGGPGGPKSTPGKGGELPVAPLPKNKGDEGGPESPKSEPAFKPIPKATDDDVSGAAPAKKPDKDDAKKDVTEGKKDKPRPEKISWAEQNKWRDGSAANLQGGGTYYLTRKIVSTRARTAVLQIDGPVGFKVWLNGEVVQASAPPAPVAPIPIPPKKDAMPGDDEDPATPEFDPFDPDAFMGRVRSKTEKKFRIGLRQGENEIVVKVVFAGQPGGRPGAGGPGMRGPGGGSSFTFNLTAEGDDVITHEVATALRLEEQERIKSPTRLPIAPAPRPVAAPVAPDFTPSLKEDPKKVGIAGEKTAPLKPEEDDDTLSPSERRQKVLRDYYRSHIDPVGRVIAEELAKLKDEEKELKRQMPQTLVMEELETPRQAYVFIRGLYKNRGENVIPATPAVLPPMPPEFPRNRLGLAKWLVSGQHPLTARVLVNRIWQQYFGLGLVRTAEDFGIRGEVPTHPELLDYLATEIVSGGWDLKKFHKRIVLSATYRQSAVAPREKWERDPENRLFSRGPRLRLTAEMIRDNALAVSGLLFEKIGGESVKPVQPKDAWKTVDGFTGAYRRDRDEKQYRRGLYVYWKRGSPYPSMLNFDACKRDTPTVTRATTTTPLQALTLLNDPAYVECAKMLGQRMLKDKEAIGRARDLTKPEEDAKRLAYGFRLCTSRAPTEKEVGILRGLLDDQRAHFKADAGAAKKFLNVGDAKVDEAIDPTEAAAWASVGSALLNLDATIHR